MNHEKNLIENKTTWSRCEYLTYELKLRKADVLHGENVGNITCDVSETHVQISHHNHVIIQMSNCLNFSVRKNISLMYIEI